MKTWTEIRNAADAAGFYHGWMAAEENAADTVAEKTVRPEEFEKIAMASLQESLAYGSLSAAEHKFYVDLGIKF